MKIGQPVEVTADIYGDKVVYHGTVVVCLVDRFCVFDDPRHKCDG